MHVRAIAARGSNHSEIKHKTIAESLRELFVEIEGIRHQNLALRKEIGLHKDYLQVLQGASQSLDAEQYEPVLPSTDELSGWRVYFPTASLPSISILSLATFSTRSWTRSSPRWLQNHLR